MKTFKYFSLAMACLFFAGCSSEHEEDHYLPETMQFSANLPKTTRVTATNFEAGDKIGIYVTEYHDGKPSALQLGGNYANNVPTVFDGTKWNCSNPIYWQEGSFDVFAYYPFDKPTSVNAYDFQVALDQSTSQTEDGLGGYEQSDFLFASQKEVQQMDVIPLSFRHCLSKFIVNLVKGPEFEGEFPDDIKVLVHNTIPEATIDLTTGIATKKSTSGRHTIIANKLSNDKFEAIIVPQRIETKLPLVEIISKGISYLVESRFVFKAGTQHAYNITINGNPDQIKIEIGGEIEGNWEK